MGTVSRKPWFAATPAMSNKTTNISLVRPGHGLLVTGAKRRALPLPLRQHGRVEGHLPALQLSVDDLHRYSISHLRLVHRVIRAGVVEHTFKTLTHPHPHPSHLLLVLPPPALPLLRDRCSSCCYSTVAAPMKKSLTSSLHLRLLQMKTTTTSCCRSQRHCRLHPRRRSKMTTMTSHYDPAQRRQLRRRRHRQRAHPSCRRRHRPLLRGCARGTGAADGHGGWSCSNRLHTSSCP